MNAHLLSVSERKALLASLTELYGIKDLPYLFLQTNKERMRAFSGDLSVAELLELDSVANVEIVGLYFAKPEYGTRLSFDATHLIGHLIKKNILDLSEEEGKEWMRGNGLVRAVPRGVYVIRCGEDFMGCGYSDGEKMWNFVPKERRFRR